MREKRQLIVCYLIFPALGLFVYDGFWFIPHIMAKMPLATSILGVYSPIIYMLLVPCTLTLVWKRRGYFD